MRNAWIAAAVSVVVAGTAGGLAVWKVEAAAADCPVERLALPSPGAYSLVFGMDPDGRYVIGRTGRASGSSVLDVLVWADGEPRRVEVPGQNQLPAGVNAAGVVVGTTQIPSAAGAIERQGWVYRDGVVSLLPGAGSIEVGAVSDDGVVVGAQDGRPAVWRRSSDVPSALPLPDAAATGKANDISPDGQTIVGMQRSGARLRPFVWTADGTPRELPLPVIAGETTMDASASSITGDWIAGMATTARSDSGVPVRWNLRTGTVEAFPDYDLGGLTVSADGQLTAEEGRRAVLLGGSETLTLRRLDDATSLPDRAHEISRDGRTIAGDASSGKAGGTAPVLWHCTKPS